MTILRAYEAWPDIIENAFFQCFREAKKTVCLWSTLTTKLFFFSRDAFSSLFYPHEDKKKVFIFIHILAMG